MLQANSGGIVVKARTARTRATCAAAVSKARSRGGCGGLRLDLRHAHGDVAGAGVPGAALARPADEGHRADGLPQTRRATAPIGMAEDDQTGADGSCPQGRHGVVGHESGGDLPCRAGGR
ncbi:hypothetical protein [Streptomyces abikoensis]|uniref:hypothetical protein n=1 Tax=Streptomyces abikoensis TaxID=97398 RepID=UPI003695E481